MYVWVVCVCVCVCVCVWGGREERGSTFLFYDFYTLPHKHRHPITTSNHLQGRTKVALPLWFLVTLEGEEKERRKGGKEKGGKGEEKERRKGGKEERRKGGKEERRK